MPSTTNSTTAQRRGGRVSPRAETIVVHEENPEVALGGGETAEDQHHPLLLTTTDPLLQKNDNENPTSSVPRKTVVATVHRNTCGTGPFDKYWLNLDCCGLFCALFTYWLHAYGVYAVVTILIPPWMSTITTSDTETDPQADHAAAAATEMLGMRSLTWTGWFHSTLFCTLACLAVMAHFKAMTTDPGTVPPDATPVPLLTSVATDAESPSSPSITTPPVRRLCRRCKTFKPERAHHCSICRRCVIKMDHHCPWVNNCVGIGNHKYFLLFVLYTALTCIYSMVLVIWRFSSCMSEYQHHHGAHGAMHRHNRYNGCLDRPTQLLSILGLMVEALLFGMFTICMMCDQTDVIFSKLTHIDKLKGAVPGGSLPGVAEVFGVGRRHTNKHWTRFRWDWLSPLATVCFPPSVQDEVMGFCRPVQQEKEQEMRTLRAVTEIV